jgi:hypothetical protein
MIEWGSFFVVFAAAVIAACVVMTLFSLGLRLASPQTTRTRRGLGIACFVLCALAMVLGVSLVIPAFTPFFANL